MARQTMVVARAGGVCHHARRRRPVFIARSKIQSHTTFLAPTNPPRAIPPFGRPPATSAPPSPHTHSGPPWPLSFSLANARPRSRCQCNLHPEQLCKYSLEFLRNSGHFSPTAVCTLHSARSSQYLYAQVGPYLGLHSIPTSWLLIAGAQCLVQFSYYNTVPHAYLMTPLATGSSHSEFSNIFHLVPSAHTYRSFHIGNHHATVSS